MASATNPKATKKKTTKSKVNQSIDTPIPPQLPSALGAKCGQCGRELRHVPFLLKNLMCRDCYGLDRYRRTNPLPTTDKPREVVMADQDATPVVVAV